MTDVAPVSVSRRIPAGSEAIFAVLTDPNRHQEIDGSGMLRGAIDPSPVTALGDVFAMKMHHSEIGNYEMNNTVVEFEHGRVIAWEPSRRDDADAEPWHYRWRYELTPSDEGGTVVTESFDYSRSPAELREATKDGTCWIDPMTDTLERLERICTSVGSPGAA